MDRRQKELGDFLRARRERLTPEAEKDYLLNLALECPPPPKTRGEAVVTPALRQILTSMNVPVLVYGPRWDILAYNEAANALYDIDYVPAPKHDHNRLRYVFTRVGEHPRVRRLVG
jgi:hypothetical protein